MNDWEKFNEVTLSEKEEFYGNLNVKGITNTDYMHAKRDCKYFEITNLGEFMICILRVIHYFQLIFSRTSEKYV